jgi:hypothetical protein
LRVCGHLDVRTGGELLHVVRSAVDRHPSRLEIDLQAMETFTPEGVAALSACGAYTGSFPGGLHMRTMGDAAREAVLTAFS